MLFRSEAIGLKRINISYLLIKELSFGFPGSPTLLDGISLSAEKNQIITIFGETGCGKSTLLNILQRLYLPESSEIYINGKDWGNLSIPEWRENVALVPQNLKTFNKTIIDNVIMDNTINEQEQFFSFCNHYGFDKYFEKFPQSYMTLLGEGASVSAGQLQLIALARAIYKRPQILLLDEPTSAMDKQTEDFVMQLLFKLKKDMIIIIATHQVHLVEKSNIIYILNKGKIEHCGTHNQLIEHKHQQTG